MNRNNPDSLDSKLVAVTEDQWAEWKRVAKQGGEAAWRPLAKPVSGQRDRVSIKSTDDLSRYLSRAPKAVKDAAMAEAEKLNTVYGAMVPFVISDDSEDRDGDVIDQAGWDFKAYEGNPALMFGHDHSHPLIGNGFGTHVVGPQTRSVAYFVSEEVSPMLSFFGKMADAGIYRAVSVGFIPKVWEFEEERGPYAVRFKQQELIEYSLVNVPSNRSALAEARGFGINVSPWIKEARKALDGGGGFLKAVPKDELEATVAEFTPKTLTVDFGAVRAAAEAEHAAKQAPTPTEQTSPVVAWPAVALALALSTKSIGKEDLELAVRRFTFGTSDAEKSAYESTVRGALEQIEGAPTEDSKAVQEEVPTQEQPATEPAEQPQEPEEAPPAGEIDQVAGTNENEPGATEGREGTAPVLLSAEEVRSLAAALLREGLDQIKAEMVGAQGKH